MKYLKWLPMIIWVAIICYLSFSNLSNYNVPKFFSADKVGHLGMYGILGVLLYFSVNKNFKLYNWSVLLGIVFALLTELIQHYFIENRTGEFGDFLANIIGLGVVYLFFKKKHN